MIEINEQRSGSFVENSCVLKHVAKGCEYKCRGVDEMVTCPSCKRFKYHLDCLKDVQCQGKNVQILRWNYGSFLVVKGV